MTILILITVYILSIFLCRFSWRLCSSKYFSAWLDEDCTASILWFIPVVNTFCGIAVGIFACAEGFGKILPKSKWFNTDI
jgi:hypothetical protein